MASFDDSARKCGNVKHSIEKPILLNLGNSSTIFCPRLPKQSYFHLQLDQDTFEIFGFF